MITIAVGCFLLLLNLLIFAGIYHRRKSEKSEQQVSNENNNHDVSKDSCCYQQQPLSIDNQYVKSPKIIKKANFDKNASVSNSLENVGCSPSVYRASDIENNIERILLNEQIEYDRNSWPDDDNNHKGVQVSVTCFTDCNEAASQTSNHVFGILKSGTPTSLMKKRVQIQEISV